MKRCHVVMLFTARSWMVFLFNGDKLMDNASFILLDDQLAGTARYYDNPVEIISAITADDIPATMARLQTCLDEGFHLAGYMAYETGFVLEPKLRSLLNTNGNPLILMGVFENYISNYPDIPCEAVPRLELKPAWSEAEYLQRFEKVIDYIKAGDVYQINLTFPLISDFDGSAICLYDTLRARQPVRYGGVISLGAGPDIVSFSPELFFDKQGADISMRPMKGTIKRLRDPKADMELREAMRYDRKSQAENLMIVDLLRNDLSRIAEKASVKVPHLFSLETYPTLHQMTSTVTATLDNKVSVQDLFKSLFPCGSVTGAPKIRAMEIIRELEPGPRGPYCGSIGYLDPNGDACFNVAIRTAMIEGGKLQYHVGSGVVLDSVGVDEYDECLLKAKVLSDIPSLVETFRWEPDAGIIRKKHHFARLASSARTLGYEYDELAFQSAVQKISGDKPQKCRLILSENGNITFEHEDLNELAKPVILSLSKHALSLGVQEFRHKVLAREFYESERSRVSAKTGCSEVIFLNPIGQVCEGSFTSIFVLIGDQLYTPPLSAGLLPGVLRGHLVEKGEVSQKTLTIDDLKTAEEIFVGNSLRGLIPAKFTDFDQY